MKIITHNGQFHADEILAIVMIKKFYFINKIERRIPTEEDMQDSTIFVLDIGGESDYSEPYSKGNFDHHQDENLLCTSSQVFEYLVDQCSLIHESIAKLMYPELYGIEPEASSLFHTVDLVDRGKAVASYDGFSSMIRSLNGMEGGFTFAIMMAEIVFKGQLHSAELRDRAMGIWINGEDHGNVRFFRTSEKMPDWRSFAENINVEFIVTPGREEDTWNLISRDAEQFPIQPDEEQLFLHNANFLAVYPDPATAIGAGNRMSLKL